MSWLSSLLGGQTTQQQTTTATPSPQATSLINQGMPFAQQFAAQGGVKLPSEAPIAPFNPNQVLGQQMALNAAPGQGDITGAAGTGNQFISSGAALNPATNPGLSQAIRYAMMPIQQNFQEQVLPKIGQDAVGAGGYGGSRQGIAEGLASRGEEQAIGSTVGNMVNANYQNALDQMVKGQAVAPSVAGSQTLPATTTSGVGDVQQAMDQALKSYGFNAGIYGQENPLATAQALMGLGAGLPGGTSTSTGQMNTQMSPLQAGMGMAGIGSALFGGQNGMFPGGLSSMASGAKNLFGGLGSSLGSLLAFA